MPPRVGIIGAGISGLTLGLRLQEAGHDVVVFDKGRGVGGRTSTRRAEGVTFDHGAQYFTVRDDRFRSFLESHLPTDRWACWEGRFGVLEEGKILPETRLEPRYVGVPGMNAMSRELASKLPVRVDSKIDRIVGQPGAWMLIDAGGASSGPFDWIVSTAPPAQTAALFAGHGPIGETVEKVRMRPCFTLMIEPSSGASFSFDGIRAGHPVLGWLANDHSKPGRGSRPALLIQSSHDWAETHVNDPLADVMLALKQATADTFGIELGAPVFESVHRWLYAKPLEPLGQDFAIDLQARLAACGDWCVAGKVEGAFLSGLALGEELKTRAVS
jgi:predicted NAD/FAD-dependent oxidoreductase